MPESRCSKLNGFRTRRCELNTPPAPPVADSYWVEPGRLIAGEYPSHWDETISRAKLRQLLQAGVTFFLDLTEEGEYDLRPYVPELRASGSPQPGLSVLRNPLERHARCRAASSLNRQNGGWVLAAQGWRWVRWQRARRASVWR